MCSSFLRDAWYCAGWNTELTQKPLGRTILGTKLVFFRDEKGAPAALGGVCPHRFAPLSVGNVRGGSIQCRYHGLQFGVDGTCVHNPHGDAALPSLRVDSYPVVERHRAIWIWMGDPLKAGNTPVPSLPMHDDSSLATTYDRLAVRASYQMICDNLLDLSHVEFLHPFLTVEANREYETLVENDVVTHIMYVPDTAKSGAFQMFWPAGPERITNRSALRWEAPGNMLLTVTATPADEPAEHGVLLYNANLVTPETATTSHYFWSLARDFRLDEAEFGEQLRLTVRKIFEEEDAWIMRLAQENMGSETDIIALRAAVLPTDRSAIRARMIMKKLLRAENNGAKSAS
jgi:phenylpropionate dioxygenase-like ring-hydroxylating dioxygenase large terminal subunit